MLLIENEKLICAMEGHFVKFFFYKTWQLWDATNGKLIRIFTGHRMWVDCCAFSPDSKYVVSGGYDKVLKIWEVATGKHIRTLVDGSHWIKSCKVSPDGKRVLSLSLVMILKVRTKKYHCF